MRADILDKIVAARRERRSREGLEQGLSDQDFPDDHKPLVFPPALICEVKRRSPSRGALTGVEKFDPVKQAARYAAAAPCAISVLTEQDHFGGSLRDLIDIRRALPETPILRKDFLLDRDDVRVSRKVGADAVLLIAAILSRAEIGDMIREAEALGMSALVEIHDEEDLEKIIPLRPALVGINSRDLRTFRVNLLGPLALAGRIDWPCTRVYESGVFYEEDALLARDAGFSTLLVGEAVMGAPERAAALARAIASPFVPAGRLDPFWNFISAALAGERRPVVKVCGITNRDDAELARDLGADILGLVYAPSPRKAPDRLAADLAADIGVPLVGVVVEGRNDEESRSLVSRAQDDLARGVLDALQLHGDAAADEALLYGWPYYQAIRPPDETSARSAVAENRGARVLVDAFDRHRPGGTGRPVNDSVLAAVIEALAERPHGELWLAGGIGPDNVAEIVMRHRPELIDASSALEQTPGRKDPTAIKRFFSEIQRAREVVDQR